MGPRLWRAALLTLVAGALVACGAAGSPEKVAEDWLAAFLKGDAQVGDLTCARLRSLRVSDLDEETAHFLLAQRTAQGLKVMGCPEGQRSDLSRLEFRPLSVAGDRATVEVTGELVEICLPGGNSLGPSSLFPGRLVWEMVKEDGAWRWCASK